MSNEIPTLDEVIGLFAKLPRNITMKEVARGCGVSESWLKQVLNGTIPNPSYEMVRTLYVFIKTASNNSAVN